MGPWQENKPEIKKERLQLQGSAANANDEPVQLPLGS